MKYVGITFKDVFKIMKKFQQVTKLRSSYPGLIYLAAKPFSVKEKFKDNPHTTMTMNFP